MKQDYFLSTSKEGFHRVAYTEWGSPDLAQNTAICAHGLTRNSRDFDALANYLSQNKYHVFCPDIVGRGDSDWLKNSSYYNYDQYILDMTALIARTFATKIDWIGTSMGGLIGMMIAALPNSPIRRLIMNDVSPQIPVHALWRLAKYVSKAPKFTSKEAAKSYFKSIYADFGLLSDAQWTQFTEHSITEEKPGVFIVKFDPGIQDLKCHGQFLKELFSHPHRAFEGVLFDVDLWSVWQEVKCPVLVIHGKHSDLLLPEHIKKMQRIHAKVDVFEVEDAGHAPALLDLIHHEKIAAWLAEEK